MLTNFASSQTKAAASQTPKADASEQSKLENAVAAKVRAEWDAFKERNKTAYGSLLVDDFVGVEDDGEGTRDKLHAVGEVETSNVYGYTLSFFKVVPLDPSAALVTYEITLEFPPKTTIRYKRMYVSELWIKRDGEWKLRHYQETRVR
jgi:hypothetical protein